jgi:hypothetical protein
MEYLLSSNHTILNQGNKPTLVISNRKEIIDLTLWKNWTGNLVRHWHVSDEPSSSDHRFILFQIRSGDITGVTFCDPKRSDSKSYEDDLILNFEATPHYVCSVQDAELAIDWMQESMPSSYSATVQLELLTRYTQTGRQFLQELCTANFPHAILTDGLMDGQEQSDLDACMCRMNREDWNLARRVINRTKT